jgi:phosphopantothenoylcysteine decarboxylase / phosphopantothenate---cysteine ligase
MNVTFLPSTAGFLTLAHVWRSVKPTLATADNSLARKLWPSSTIRYTISATESFTPMRILLTAGPTQEPIDSVRFIGNRSSGRLGRAIAEAAMRAAHEVTLILGPIAEPMPDNLPRLDVQTAQQMLEAVLTQFPMHDLLIMAAAVSDYRLKRISSGKIDRRENLVLELESTRDILAAAGKIKKPHQRTVGFSLEATPDLARSARKLAQKHLDLIVFNSTETIGSPNITSILLYPDGRTESLPSRSKDQFADILIQRSVALF